MDSILTENIFEQAISELLFGRKLKSATLNYKDRCYGSAWVLSVTLTGPRLSRQRDTVADEAKAIRKLYEFLRDIDPEVSCFCLKEQNIDLNRLSYEEAVLELRRMRRPTQVR